MRLLYLVHRFPYPPDKGERIRAFHQIRLLARHGEIHLVCPVSQQPTTEELAEVRRHCASVNLVTDSRWAAALREGTRLVAGAPRMTGTFNSASLRQTFRKVLAAHSIDRILVSTLHVAEIARAARDVPKAIDLVDVYSQIWLELAGTRRGPARWLSTLEGCRLARYEAQLAREFDSVILASKAEARLFREQISERPVEVVGNGVDLEYFRAPDAEPAARAPAIVFTGTMDYAPNVDAVTFFCRDVFPHLRARHPRVRFLVVGRDPSRKVRALAGEAGVTVTGAVDDVRRHLAGATAAVAPMRIGRGIQNKMLEAMAMGVPVVATPLTLAGLEGDPGDGARSAADAASFVRELDALLTSAEWRRHCASAARTYVERRHRWDDYGEHLGKILENLTIAQGR